MATAPKTESKPAPKINANMTVEEIPDSEPVADLNVISEIREDTRGRLATYFLIGFFIVMLVGLIVAAFGEGDTVTNSTSILLTVSGILSGPLGFVIGYYFRSKDK